MSYYRRPYYEPERERERERDSRPIVNPYKLAAKMMRAEQESSDSDDSSDGWSSNSSGSGSDSGYDSESESCSSADFCSVSSYEDNRAPYKSYGRGKGKYDQSECESDEDYDFEDDDNEDSEDQVKDFDWSMALISIAVAITLIGIGVILFIPSFRSSEVNEILEPIDAYFEPFHNVIENTKDAVVTLSQGLSKEQIQEVDNKINPITQVTLTVISGTLSEKDEKLKVSMNFFKKRIQELASNAQKRIHEKKDERIRKEAEAAEKAKAFWKIKAKEVEKEVARLEALRKEREVMLEKLKKQREDRLTSIKGKQETLDKIIESFPRKFRPNFDEINKLTKQAFNVLMKIEICRELHNDLYNRKIALQQVINWTKEKKKTPTDKFVGFLEYFFTVTDEELAKDLPLKNTNSQDYNKRKTKGAEELFRGFNGKKIDTREYSSLTEDYGNSDLSSASEAKLAQVLDELDSEMFTLDMRNTKFSDNLTKLKDKIDANINFFWNFNQLRRHGNCKDALKQSVEQINEQVKGVNAFKIQKLQSNLEVKILEAWHQRMLLRFLTHHKMVHASEMRMHELKVFEKYSENLKNWFKLLKLDRNLSPFEIATLYDYKVPAVTVYNNFQYEFKFPRLISDYERLYEKKFLYLPNQNRDSLGGIKFHENQSTGVWLSGQFFYSKLSKITEEEMTILRNNWPVFDIKK